jgi:hypothetical protein
MDVLQCPAEGGPWSRRRLVDGTAAERVLPAAFAIAMGVLVGAVQRGDTLAASLAFAGAIFVLLR